MWFSDGQRPKRLENRVDYQNLKLELLINPWAEIYYIITSTKHYIIEENIKKNKIQWELNNMYIWEF